MKLIMQCINIMYYVDECDLTRETITHGKKQKRYTYNLSVIDRINNTHSKVTECVISIDSEDPYLFEEGRQYILSLEEIQGLLIFESYEEFTNWVSIVRNRRHHRGLNSEPVKIQGEYFNTLEEAEEYIGGSK